MPMPTMAMLSEALILTYLIPTLNLPYNNIPFTDPTFEQPCMTLLSGSTLPPSTYNIDGSSCRVRAAGI